MSIKTLRKRIALVAVSALGVGLLSVAPASAGAPTAGREIGIDYSESQVCALYNPDGDLVTVDVTTSTGDDGALTVVMPMGGRLAVENDAAADANNYLIISGGLTADVANTNDDSDGLSVNAAGKVAVLATESADTVYFIATSLGAASITAAGTDVNAVLDADDAINVTVVASCATSAVDLGESFIATSTDSDSADPSGNVDTSTVATAGQSLYIGIIANNTYGSAVSSGTWSASATNGALVSLGANVDSAPLKGTQSVVTGTDSGELVVRVSPKTTGVAQTTTVTVAYNGATVTTKSLTFLGEASKINVLGVYTGTNGSTGVIVWNLTDAAGNSVPGAITMDPLSATQRVPSLVATATAGKDATLSPAAPANATLAAAIGSTSYGVSAYNCTASAGTGTAAITIRHFQPVSEEYITAAVTAKCAGGIDKYTVSMDKASYKIGEIATMTIAATDSTGAAVSDFTSVGTGASVSAGGMSQIGSLATADTFTAGNKTYKFKVETAGSFNAAAVISGTTTKSATASYTVTGGGVSNEEVLAAIVKLIASINKQIKALQKSLRR